MGDALRPGMRVDTNLGPGRVKLVWGHDRQMVNVHFDTGKVANLNLALGDVVVPCGQRQESS